MLASAALIALVADRLVPTSAVTRPKGRGEDLSAWVRAPKDNAVASAPFVSVPVDPFDRGTVPSIELATIPTATTAPSPRPPASRLSAILIADERRVAVIDDIAVTTGDVLRDGARVARINDDRVWVVDRTGRWRQLMLATRGQ